MSNEDVKLDNEYEEPTEAEEVATTEAEDAETEEPVAGEPEEAEDEGDEYEIIERKPEPSPEAKRNAAFAKQRIEASEAKKRLKEAEEQLQQIERGNIPEHLKEVLSIAPALPDQPVFDNYFSDTALEKYGYDSAKAQAAFNAAQSQWLYNAQNARTTSQVQEVQKREEYIKQQRKRVELNKGVAEAAGKLRLASYDTAEQALNGIAAGASDLIAEFFGRDANKAAVVINHLGLNPDEAKRINSLSKIEAFNEISKLGYETLIIRKKSKATPEADSGLEGGNTAVNTKNWAAELGKLLVTDTAKYRARKKEIEKQLGRSISNHEI